MFRVIQQGDTVDYGVIIGVCDTRADVALLPTSWAPGSAVLVIEDSSVVMLNTEAEWCFI